MGEFTIIGAGAIGSIVGVLLAENGHSVAFVESDAAHVEAIRRSGLRLTGYRDVQAKVPVLHPGEVTSPLRNVLLAVKAQHTADALAPLAPFLQPDGCVVSLQNGLEEYRIARIVGKERTVGAFLNFGGYFKGPGEITYDGPGMFRIGELDGSRTRRITELRDALADVQPVEITSNILGYLWSKVALLAIWYATAVTDDDVPVLYREPRYRALFERLAAEVVAVAEAEHARLETIDGFDPSVFSPHVPRDAQAVAAAWDGQLRYWDSFPNGPRRTAIWMDMAIRKRKTDVDQIVGTVIEFAGRHDIHVPAHLKLLSIVHEVETGRRGRDRGNLDELGMQLSW